jgi:hypothetical protein
MKYYITTSFWIFAAIYNISSAQQQETLLATILCMVLGYMMILIAILDLTLRKP